MIRDLPQGAQRPDRCSASPESSTLPRMVSTDPEHTEVALFCPDELDGLVVPDRYRDAITHWSPADAARLLAP